MASERAPGDWFDSYAWFTRYKDQQDKRIKAELAEEAAAEAARARELERQRVEAGDPAAMRSFLERLCREQKISIIWTANSDQWLARGLREVSIPPPIDHSAFAIALHEVGHCLAGPCAGSHHQAQREGRTHRCLECERLAWEKARMLVPFSRAMFEKLRQCLSTYRRGRTPAPPAAKQRADREMGFVQWGLEHQRRIKWQARVDAVARWKRELERERNR